MKTKRAITKLELKLQLLSSYKRTRYLWRIWLDDNPEAPPVRILEVQELVKICTNNIKWIRNTSL